MHEISVFAALEKIAEDLRAHAPPRGGGILWLAAPKLIFFGCGSYLPFTIWLFREAEALILLFYYEAAAERARTCNWQRA